MFTSRKKQIDQLYKQILCREVDTNGLKHWAKSNLPIDEIHTQLLHSDEYKSVLQTKLAFNNTLIEQPRVVERSVTVPFWDSDTEAQFQKNKETFGPSWKYYNTPITYEINSLGYRMKEFDQIDWSNYMVVLGCSHTAGVGLNLEETWPYRISQELNMDLVNGAIPGGTNEFMLMNLTRLLNNRTPPKLVVFNWTYVARQSYRSNGGFEIYGLAEQPTGKWEDEWKKYLASPQDWAYDFLELKERAILLCKLAGIPAWHITHSDQHYYDDTIELIPYNFFPTDRNYEQARDIYDTWSHSGKELQDRVIESWHRAKKTIIQ